MPLGFTSATPSIFRRRAASLAVHCVTCPSASCHVTGSSAARHASASRAARSAAASLAPRSAAAFFAAHAVTAFRAIWCANGPRAARLAAACFAAVLFACFSFAPLAVLAGPQPMAAERILFESANRERATLGLPQLRWDETLAAAARQHAELMVQYNALSHQFSGEPSLQDRTRQAGARYSVIAENVAMGPSADVIHSSWMHSPPHRANLLDRDLTAVGIAVVTSLGRNSGAAGATLFAVEDFSQTVVSLSFEQQEKQVSALLATRGLQVANSNAAADDARKTCEMDRGFAGSRPNLVVRYEASDLSRLPDDLEQKIRSGTYRTAAVGACDSGGSRGFTRFRITVLLY